MIKDYVLVPEREADDIVSLTEALAEIPTLEGVVRYIECPQDKEAESDMLKAILKTDNYVKLVSKRVQETFSSVK